MVIVKISGGLGNQLFQYATALSIVLKRGTELKIDSSEYVLTPARTPELENLGFEVQKALLAEIPFSRRIRKWSWESLLTLPLLKSFTIAKEKTYHYDCTINNLRGNLYLDGYWQSFKYFEEISTLIIKQLHSSPTSECPEPIASLITRPGSVAIHVRRGDYVNNPYHPLCNLDFYYAAISNLRTKVQSPVFFIFSDDIEWCKENLRINTSHFFVSGNSAAIDFKLMLRCHHFIIANSTFSWWAAYGGLATDKIVIAPKKWFYPYKAHRNYTTKDLFPNDWLLL